MTPLLFAVGAGAGALVRFGAGLLPWRWRSTLRINVAGALLLGWLVGGGATGDARTVLGTGFCGALTTYSTFALEVVTVERRERWLVVGSNVVLGVAAAALGAAIAS